MKSHESTDFKQKRLRRANEVHFGAILSTIKNIFSQIFQYQYDTIKHKKKLSANLYIFSQIGVIIEKKIYLCG